MIQALKKILHYWQKIKKNRKILILGFLIILGTVSGLLIAASDFSVFFGFLDTFSLDFNLFNTTLDSGLIEDGPLDFKGVPSVRCPSCKAEGIEVWVIYGKCCPRCGTACDYI